MRTTVLAALLCGALLTARSARAIDPFEIQVYEGDINMPRQAGLELHSNVAVPRASGMLMPGPTSRSLLRVTLEPSFGILEWWEVGAYLQFALELGDPRGHFGGYKLRSKWIVPRRLTGNFVLGLNVEVGRGTEVFQDTDWDTEFRPILVWTAGRWMVALNPMVGWVLSGPDAGLTPDLEPAGKARFDTGRGLGVGLEYYAGLGTLGRLEPVDRQEHLLYLIADLVGAPFDLNVGIGRGLTGPTSAWSIKTILGIGF